MTALSAAPLLIGILLGLLSGVLGWEYIHTRHGRRLDAEMGVSDDLLLGLVVLAAFALGVFLTFLLTGTF